MEMNSQLWTIIVYVFKSCCATILVKFGRLPLHYGKLLEKGGQHSSDPLRDFDLPTRQLLCDSVINARQFMLRYRSTYYENEKKKHTPRVHIHWDLPAVFANATWNYQRLSHANASLHEYKLRRVQLTNDLIWVRSLCCVYTKEIKWYLTFGLVDHFLYLLEKSQNIKHPGLLFTGILEPSALVDPKSLLYFRSQLSKGKFRMESLWKMAVGDKVRICSAIYDALGMGNGARLNYQKIAAHNYAIRGFHSRYGDHRKFKFLPCIYFRTEPDLESFYALADIRERSAVFVFFDDKTHSMVVEMTRVTKIAALLNPVGLDERRKPKTVTLDEDSATKDFDDEPSRMIEKRKDWRQREKEADDGVEERNKIVSDFRRCKGHKKATDLSKIGERRYFKRMPIINPTPRLSRKRESRNDDEGCETSSTITAEIKI